MFCCHYYKLIVIFEYSLLIVCMLFNATFNNISVISLYLFLGFIDMLKIINGLCFLVSVPLFYGNSFHPKFLIFYCFSSSFSWFLYSYPLPLFVNTCIIPVVISQIHSIVTKAYYVIGRY